MKEKYQKITVGGLLIENNKALVVKRSPHEKFLGGYYELPGGKVDFGEHPKQALEREFLEEVNLNVTAEESPYRVFTDISDEGKRHTIELVYRVVLKDNVKNIKLSGAHTDFKWVTFEELKKFVNN